MSLELEIIQSPFTAHSNLLFKFTKLFLVDENIYDRSEQALPYTDKPRKYKLRLTGVDRNITIRHNNIDIIDYAGTGTFDFYVNPVLGKNEFLVVDNTYEVTNKERLCYLLMNCYNIHSFLAFIAYKFKAQWNKLYQGLANRFTVTGVFQDMDGNYLIPEYKISKDFARLLGTTRYSKFTDEEYFAFIHELVDIHNYGGKYLGIYKIQEALTDYISKIDILQLEQYQPQHNKLYEKVYQTSATGIKIYPTYKFQPESNEWGLLPYLEDYALPNSNIGVTDTTSSYSQWVITNGTLYSDTTNWGSLQVLGSDVVYLPGLEYSVTDVFTPLDIFTDGTDGTYTGFAGSKFVTLRNTVVDGSSLTITSVAPVKVENSFRYVPEYNLVDLGTMYTDGTISVTYKTFDNLNVLAKLQLDGPNIIDVELSGHNDKHYLSYKDDNYGTVVIVVKAKQYIDSELRKIISDIIKNIIPAHIKYYIVYVITRIFDYAGQEDQTLDEIENANASNVVWTELGSNAESFNGISTYSTAILAVGDSGIYYYTPDNLDITAAGIITTENLLDCDLMGTTSGIVVGENGTIYITNNGYSWINRSDASYGHVYDVCSVPASPSMAFLPLEPIIEIYENIYFGNSGIDGTWVIRFFADKISFERRESSEYVVKSTIPGTYSLTTAITIVNEFFYQNANFYGNWTIRQEGNDLVFQRVETGGYQTKATILA